MVHYREKMVDRDALCPINVMSFEFNQLQHRPDKFLNDSSDKPINLIFYTPNVANTDNCLIVQTIAF